MTARYYQLWGRSEKNPRIVAIERILQREHNSLHLTEAEYICLMQGLATTVAIYNLAKKGVNVSSIGFPDLTPRNFLSQELMGHMKLPYAIADEIRDALDYIPANQLLVR